MGQTLLLGKRVPSRSRGGALLVTQRIQSGAVGCPVSGLGSFDERGLTALAFAKSAQLWETGNLIFGSFSTKAFSHVRRNPPNPTAPS